ncbi:hypothetical protein MSAN_00903400 [Mycena sanguinolenta]|uniref:Uncharacterized protein n=1 Tax=Mycena sanguinolenta TaxID=230812 RepID=A0A8H6YWG3_9AGAR|nr:hypothetical protein MSAN_00903400 [Mycena sanguinolenta]
MTNQRTVIAQLSAHHTTQAFLTTGCTLLFFAAFRSRQHPFVSDQQFPRKLKRSLHAAAPHLRFPVCPMRDELSQIFSFTFATILSLNSGSDVIRYLALMVVFIVGARYCLVPILPWTRIRVLQYNLEETEGVLRLALSESLRDRIPPFVLHVELDLLCARLFASHLKSDLLLAKNLPWPEYLRLLRDISLKAARSQRQVRELRLTIMLAIEAERQRRYNDSICEKREVISSLISTDGLAVAAGPVRSYATRNDVTRQTVSRERGLLRLTEPPEPLSFSLYLPALYSDFAGSTCPLFSKRSSSASTPKSSKKSSKSASASKQKQKQVVAIDTDDEPEDEYDSDALDDSDDGATKKRKRKTEVKKKARSPKKKKTVDTDDEEFDLEDGQEIVGVVVEAPKTGLVPAGQISKNTFDFLLKLQSPGVQRSPMVHVRFKLHDAVYRQAEKEWKDFIEVFTDLLIEEDDQIPPLPPKDVIHRIYRDIRFSNNKTPYKTGFSASFSRSGRKGIFAVYHVMIKPGNQSMIAAGAWCPGKNELETIRSNIKRDPTRLRQTIAESTFVKYFGEPKPGKRSNIFGGEDELKVAPKGVAKDHRDIDLLKCRSFAVSHQFTDTQVLSPDFKTTLAEIAAVATPFVHCLNDMMTVPPDAEDDEDDG